MRFDASDRESVLRHGLQLVGRTAHEIAQTASEGTSAWDPNTSKGSVGRLVERWFGLEANSDTGPDLAEAGIEIKSVPLRRASRELRSKERTSITMIDYHRVAVDPFVGAPLDLKTRLTLYVFFLWSQGDVARAGDQRILRVILHERDQLDLVALTDAYAHVQRASRAGRAHLLSEGDTSPVGAATKGAKGATRTQPLSDVRARPRAFAWRPAYTTGLFHSTPHHTAETASPMPCDSRAPSRTTGAPCHRLPLISGVDDLTRLVEKRLEPLLGATVEQLRGRYAPSVSATAKNVAAATFRRILAGGDEDLASALERLGTTVRVSRVNPVTLRPHEAVSFTPFDFREVAETPWEESDVLATLGRILFIVLDAPKGATVGEARLRSVVTWSAGPDTIATMEREYEAFRLAFMGSPPSEWPSQRSTEVLHVRPHGRDGSDVVPLPSGEMHVRSSLWLNQRFVQEIIMRHGA
jgi:DNA mismatch repair protein MutH